MTSRPIRSLSGTVAGFFRHISHIFFAITHRRIRLGLVVGQGLEFRLAGNSNPGRYTSPVPSPTTHPACRIATLQASQVGSRPGTRTLDEFWPAKTLLLRLPFRHRKPSRRVGRLVMADLSCPLLSELRDFINLETLSPEAL